VDPDTPTEPAGSAEPDEADEAAEREADWQRRRRLAEVFGDTTPDQTSDDRDPREDRSGKGDDWYREQVPPHHG
jgi:hypothetical protein